MTTPGARRLVLEPGEVAELCARLGLSAPPGFSGARQPLRTRGLLSGADVHPAVAAGIAATCGGRLAVLVAATVGGVTAALGMRGGLGGSMLRADASGVEVSAWPAARLGAELARTVPPITAGVRPRLHVPTSDLAARPELRPVVGRLTATVLAPPYVIGQVVWFATPSGWLAVEPAAAVDGHRWVTTRPVEPADLGPAVAPYVAAAVR